MAGSPRITPDASASERGELAADAAGQHHRAAEVADVLGVDVDPEAPAVLLQPDADAHAEPDVVGGGGRDGAATRAAIDAAHQVEHAQLEGAEDALPVAADV